MLRNILGAGVRAWTCTCRVLPPSGTSCTRRPIHSTLANLVLDKDIRGKKATQDSKIDSATLTQDEEEDELIDFQDITPTAETDSMIIAGRRFDELPIAYIKASTNNTIMTLTDYKGAFKFHNSGGTEGFKNAKKGTTIAAQATGLSMGQRALSDGIKHVRVKVKGIGPGRLPAIKGLQMAGMTIVSITDNTPVEYYTRRARKQRRV